MRRLSWIFAILFAALCESWGQSIPLYPDVQTSYQFNMPAITPAYLPEDTKVEAGGIYKFRPGQANLAFYEMNAGVTFGPEENRHQLMRLNFSNDKEGPYINTSRANLNYAYRIRLAEELSLASGISFGFANRSYTAPSSTGQGNVFLPDGNFGLELKRKHDRFGATISQFLNSGGRAIQSRAVLRTYYQFYALLKQRLSPEWFLKENLLIRLLPQVTDQLIGGVALSYFDQYSFGVNYYQRRGLSFQVTAALNHEDDPLKLSISYNAAFLSASPIWANSIELGLNFRVR